MKLFPMTLIVSESAIDITVEGLAYEAELNVNSVKMLLDGGTIHVAEDFLDTIKRVNSHYAGKLILLTGEAIDLGDDVSLDMNAL